MTARRAPVAPPTLASWLARAEARLHAAGTQSPGPEARRIAAHALGVGWGALWALQREPVDGNAGLLEALLARRERHEPLAYVLGTAVLDVAEVRVGPGVLVPRPETETLVATALRLVDGVRRPLVVDLCTGSGAVALAIAAHRPDARVVATDVSRDALAWARRNCEGTRVVVRAGDLYGALDESTAGGVDLVVANPPYVPAGRTDLLGADVAHEPAVALFGGPSGDEVVNRVLDGAAEWTSPRGAVCCEVGTPGQAARASGRLAAWPRRGVDDDAAGRPRVVWAAR